MAVSLLPILVPGNKPGPWKSSGPMARPAYCSNCPYQKVGYGFCPDWVGSDPKISLMLTTPSSDDLNAQRGLSGGMGWFIFKSFIEPAGFTQSNLIISHTLRCRPPRDRRGRISYPTGNTKKRAERICRKYDGQYGKDGKLVGGGMAKWSPSVILLTFDPADVRINPSYHRQILRDFERAMMLVSHGFRPLVLMGKEPAELFAPHIVGNGGLKGWRGDYYEINPSELIISGGGDGMTFGAA